MFKLFSRNINIIKKPFYVNYTKYSTIKEKGLEVYNNTLCDECQNDIKSSINRSFGLLAMSLWLNAEKANDELNNAKNLIKYDQTNNKEYNEVIKCCKEKIDMILRDDGNNIHDFYFYDENGKLFHFKDPELGNDLSKIETSPYFV